MKSNIHNIQLGAFHGVVAHRQQGLQRLNGDSLAPIWILGGLAVMIYPDYVYYKKFGMKATAKNIGLRWLCNVVGGALFVKGLTGG
jgi:hypothetical protein